MIYKIKLTKDQVFDLASKIFDEINEGEGFGDLKDQNSFVINDWMNAAYDAIEGYNTVVKNVDFPNISVVKNCCRLCKFVDLYRPACNLHGDDINLACVCGKFELFEFEADEE